MTLPFAQVLVSDDIRQELGGKSTIVGIYSGAMDFGHPEMPPVLPRIGLTFLLRWPDRAQAAPVTLKVYGPADQDNPLAELQLDPRDVPQLDPELTDGSPALGLRGQLVMEQVPLRAPSAFVVMVSDAESSERVLYLPVRHRPLDAAQLMASLGVQAAPPP